MNTTKNLFAASLLAVLSGVALADGGSAVDDTFVSARTRADVQAETLQARATGHLVPAGEGPAAVVPFSSQLRRADVAAGVLQARASGELIAAGEASFDDTPFVSTLSRASVKAEVLQARAAGRLVPAGEAVYAGASSRGVPAATGSGAFAGLFRSGRSAQ